MISYDSHLQRLRDLSKKTLRLSIAGVMTVIEFPSLSPKVIFINIRLIQIVYKNRVPR